MIRMLRPEDFGGFREGRDNLFLTRHHTRERDEALRGVLLEGFFQQDFGLAAEKQGGVAFYHIGYHHNR